MSEITPEEDEWAPDATPYDDLVELQDPEAQDSP